MSDSELSDAPMTPLPPDHELEKSLRREVVKAHQAGIDGSTVNSIRAASEDKLGLKSDFYKNHDTWGPRSKQIIKEQIAIQDNTPSSPPPPSKARKDAASDSLKKRASEEREPWPRKRKKVVNEPEKPASSDELSSPQSESDFGSPEEKPKKRQQRKISKPAATQKTKTAIAPKKKRPAAKVDEDSDQPEDDNSESEQEKKDELKEDVDDLSGGTKAKNSSLQQDEDDDSDLSELLDEAPPPKKRQKQGGSAGNKSTKSKPAKSKPEADPDPDQAEIKRLQGWLVKCGIRKVWGKELKPYESPKAKVKHLKEMLTDAGMTGRYSVEKANQIKEARELAADIEAVQEGAERWGADDDDEDDNGRVKEDGRPVRRLVRGAKNYDFLSSDGEETD